MGNRARQRYQRAYGIAIIDSRITNDDNDKTPVWDNIPGWVIFALEYGTQKEPFLSDEDKRMIAKFIAESFPNSHTVLMDWESYREFDANPALGKVCKTYRVTFIIPKE